MWLLPGSNPTRYRVRREKTRITGTKRERTKDKLVLSECNLQGFAIPDHNGNDVRLAWCSEWCDGEPVDKPPPFAFQVYLTNTTKETIKDIASFAQRFTCFIEWIGGVPHHGDGRSFDRSQRPNREGFYEDEYGSRDYGEVCGIAHYRFEVYAKPFTNVLACISHQRMEIVHRNRNGTWPRLVSTWTTHEDHGYRGRIIVIDRDDWMEAGVVVASFDPMEYRRPNRYRQWNIAGTGDHNLVEVSRIGSRSVLRETFRHWWIKAGHGWAEADLARRNEGAVSPVLYPAIDPTAHYDAEHEDVLEGDAITLAGPALQRNLDLIDRGINPIINTFDKNELFQQGGELKYLHSESYSDNFSLPITSVWDSRISALRPAFSITIYLGYDMIPVEPKALFTCLNKGLIANEAWTLDIVRNMPGIEASFDYHSRASAERSLEKTLDRSSCMEMLLRKVVDNRLPNELVNYIKELLVPPEIPDYSARPTRLFKNVFMYLDASSLSTGPRLVYSEPANFWPDTESGKGAFTNPGRWSSALLREHGSQHFMIRVTNLRYWHRVADEVHILWSFCSARSTSVDSENLPQISMTVNMPQEIRRNEIRTKLTEIDFELHYSKPITVPVPFLSHMPPFEIIDLETGRALPQLPFPLEGINSCHASWSQSPDLGLNLDDNHQQTLWPSRPTGKQICWERCPSNRFGQSWLRPYDHIEDFLLSNHSYAIRLHPHLNITRWTFGDREEKTGPYNLPPIPVVVSDESQLTFRCV